MKIGTKIMGSFSITLGLILFFQAVNYYITSNSIDSMEKAYCEVRGLGSGLDTRRRMVARIAAVTCYGLYGREDYLRQAKYSGGLMLMGLDVLRGRARICGTRKQLDLLDRVRADNDAYGREVAAFVQAREKGRDKAEASNRLGRLEEMEDRMLDGLEGVMAETARLGGERFEGIRANALLSKVFPLFLPILGAGDKMSLQSGDILADYDMGYRAGMAYVASRRFLLTGGVKHVSDYRRHMDGFKRALDRRFPQGMDEEGGRPWPAGELLALSAKNQGAFEEGAALYLAGREREARASIEHSFVDEELLDSAVYELTSSDEKELRSFYEALAPVMSYSLAFNRRVFVFLALASIVSLAAGSLLVKRMIRPINMLTDASSRIARGDWTLKVDVRSNDEIAAMAESFNKMTAEVERSNRELQDFAFVASHDLQAPLRKIVSFSQLLEASLKDRLDEDDRENLAFLLSSAERMQKLIRDLLTYSRIETRGRPPAPVDLGKALASMLELSLDDKVAAMGGSVRILGELPAVMADEIQLHMLLQNLVENGLKYHRLGAAPEVVVSARKTPDGMVRVEVVDNGMGIDPRHHEKIFRMFQRLHGADRDGTGIGLSICQRIVSRHGGEIGVASRPGEGSTFWFTLRAAGDAALPRELAEAA